MSQLSIELVSPVTQRIIAEKICDTVSRLRVVWIWIGIQDLLTDWINVGDLVSRIISATCRQILDADCVDAIGAGGAGAIGGDGPDLGKISRTLKSSGYDKLCIVHEG